ncbi:MAG: hypothetical protein K0S23_2635 [Fluviicola sp.]|jgi:hypothetical protein|uniref:hypothetical protein n=1 Tax=Fluviicola sp. TaxID=1917219 RepID=UPI00263605D2|nr:hypothetical protein [Fluviicola sp.]MDF3028328.1 hypothetical protein [Fluviicola sp.]
MENETLDSIVMTSAPTRNLEGAGSILAMGIISIPFCLGFIGIILAIFTLVRSGKAINEFNKNPLLYTESSLKKVKAGRICSIVSLSLLGTCILIIIAVGGLG